MNCVSPQSDTTGVIAQRVLLSKMYLPGEEVHNAPSSSAATGPNPRAGRPLQGPGVHRRDPPMDGTWPVERGGTATSSKCRQGVQWEHWGSPRLPKCY